MSTWGLVTCLYNVQKGNKWFAGNLFHSRLLRLYWCCGAQVSSELQNASDTQNGCHGAWRWAQCPLLDPYLGAPFMLLTKPGA